MSSKDSAGNTSLAMKYGHVFVNEFKANEKGDVIALARFRQG